MKHRKEKARKGSRTRAAVPRHETADVASLEELRTKYLPGETKLRTAQKKTPSEIGEDLARKSLGTARQALAS